MEAKKSNLFFMLGIMVSLVFIGGIVYFVSFEKQENNRDFQKQLAMSSAKVQNSQNSLRSIILNHNLMQDQYILNVDEVHMIVQIVELSKQFGYLTLKEREQGKMDRLIEETHAWIAQKSIFNTYIKGMNEQLKILLTVLKSKPSYQTIGDIQNTISDIVAIMLQRSLIQTKRFYKHTEEMEKSLKLLEKDLAN